MLQLTSKIYMSPGSGPFSLRHGQQRRPFVVQNAAWYNKAGEWLGMGDLSVVDLDNIALGLEHDELFVIISNTTFMNFKGDIEAPGTEFLANAALLVVAPRQVFEMDHCNVDGVATREIKDRLTGDVLTVRYLAEDGLEAMLAL